MKFGVDFEAFREGKKNRAQGIMESSGRGFELFV